MMQILVVAAMELEISSFLKNNLSADVLLTGVGVPATIYQLSKRMMQIDYDLVIQAGIAGSFDPLQKLGRVVAVSHDTFADLGVRTSDQFNTVFEAGLADPDVFPFTAGWLPNPNLAGWQTRLERVKAVTVNSIVTAAPEIHSLVEKYQPSVESMEGAALHYICLQEKTPFLQLRALSNYAGERDKKKWEMSLALQSLNEALQQVYEETLDGHYDHPLLINE